MDNKTARQPPHAKVKEQKRAAALRDNLLKRKQQVRDRKEK